MGGRGVVLVARGDARRLQEGRVAQLGHWKRKVPLGRLREIAWAGWGVAAFHSDVRRAGAMRLPARAYLLQPHRPAPVRESTRPRRGVRRGPGPAAGPGVLDGLT